MIDAKLWLTQLRDLPVFAVLEAGMKVCCRVPKSWRVWLSRRLMARAWGVVATIVLDKPDVDTAQEAGTPEKKDQGPARINQAFQKDSWVSCRLQLHTLLSLDFSGRSFGIDLIVSGASPQGRPFLLSTRGSPPSDGEPSQWTVIRQLRRSSTPSAGLSHSHIALASLRLWVRNRFRSLRNVFAMHVT
jgi:hypothetical protein